jgi:hypothetical protein
MQAVKQEDDASLDWNARCERECGNQTQDTHTYQRLAVSGDKAKQIGPFSFSQLNDVRDWLEKARANEVACWCYERIHSSPEAV